MRQTLVHVEGDVYVQDEFVEYQGAWATGRSRVRRIEASREPTPTHGQDPWVATREVPTILASMGVTVRCSGHVFFNGSCCHCDAPESSS